MADTSGRRHRPRRGVPVAATVVAAGALLALPAGEAAGPVAAADRAGATAEDFDAAVRAVARGAGDEPDGGSDDADAMGRSKVLDHTRDPSGGDGAARTFTLVAGGDVLLHPPLWAQARADAAARGADGLDFRPLLAGVRTLVGGADLAVCHLETPLAPAGGPYAGYPSFSVPPEIAPALAATGFDACTTASNHTYDQGAAGVDRTLAALDAAGIAHAGSAGSPEEAAAVTLVRAGPARVALLSYTFGFNGVPPPAGQAWRSNMIDETAIGHDAARARAAGADVVVVSLHWGDEYDSSPTEGQRALGPRLVRSPAIDLVLGHHAHVVQPLENVDGEWIVYGMGNFVAHHEDGRPRSDEGVAVRLTFAERPGGWRATAVEYAPLLVERDAAPVRLVDVGATLASAPPGGDRAARLRAAWDRSVAAVEALGAATDGLRPTSPAR
jgi:poly-gamma-glutamate synthesis protein (capsule biosynthesis protein)